MLPILQIGPVALPLPPLLLLVAFWLGGSLSERRAAKHGASPDLLGNLLVYGLIAGILSARLGYLLRFPDAFVRSPASILSTNLDLLDPISGMAGALIFGLVYGQRKTMSFWHTLDALVPFLATLSLGVALANLAAGQAYGLPSDLPWAIDLWGAARHPVQAYQALAAATILLAMLRDRGTNVAAGIHFFSFMLLTASAHLMLGAFRAEAELLPNGWRLNQIVAWLGMAAALWGLRWVKQPGQVE